MVEKENWKSKVSRKLRNKYKLVILNDENYEERLAFRLSRINVFVLVSILSIMLIAITIVLIAFTPLREYIPGYTDMRLYEKIDYLQKRADSLEQDFDQKNLYLYNLERILEGRDTVDEIPMMFDDSASYDEITIAYSHEDSLLRADFENQSMYNIYLIGENTSRRGTSSIRGFAFFTPLEGIVTNNFNPAEGHFGIDVVSSKNEAVKATLDGVIVISNWTLETGYVLGIQHEHNLVSMYKHNSTLLKGQGDFVKAGEAIAIVGETGEMTTGLHLHFELWYNGIPLNPGDFINF